MQRPLVAKHPCICEVRPEKAAVKEPVSSCSNTTGHKCFIVYLLTGAHLHNILVGEDCTVHGTGLDWYECGMFAVCL